MKKLILIFLFLPTSLVFAQFPFNSNFEDGTLQEWTNINGAIDQLTVEGGNPEMYLHKQCDGSISPIGEMTIINTSEDWTGNFFYLAGGDDNTLINFDEINIKNDNDFDLHIRYGITGANGYMVVTTDPIIVPANTDWAIYDQYFGLEIDVFSLLNLTVINDTSDETHIETYFNIEEMFEDVVEVKLFHNPNIAFTGINVEGNLQIDYIFSYLLLDTEEKRLESANLYPNPVTDKLNVNIPLVENVSIILYSVLGDIVYKNTNHSLQSQLDISHLERGMYMVELKTKDQTTFKRIIKN